MLEALIPEPMEPYTAGRCQAVDVETVDIDVLLFFIDIHVINQPQYH